MKKIIIILPFILLVSPAYSDNLWTGDDLYLFGAVVSSQIADYSQSLKFDSIILAQKEECLLEAYQYMDPRYPIPVSGVRRDCLNLMWTVKEKNPLLQRSDGGFDENKALFLGAGLDAGIFYIGTKYPKWRRPLLYAIYAIEMLVISNNHNIGARSDTPILPVIFTWHF